MSHAEPIHTYDPAATAVIYRLMDDYGGLSNFAREYPLTVNGHSVPTNEALYQALRFPHQPDLQRLLLEEPNPAKVKRLSRDYLELTRPNWETDRKRIMRWCLQVKLAQHRHAIGNLLRASSERPIAEHAYTDQFWGATLQADGTLRGANILGLLWMELRAELLAGHWEHGRVVAPPDLPDFLLDRRPISPIVVR